MGYDFVVNLNLKTKAAPTKIGKKIFINQINVEAAVIAAKLTL